MMRADDPDDRGDDEATRIVAGQQRLGDRPSDGAEDDERDDPHVNLLSRVCTRSNPCFPGG